MRTIRLLLISSVLWLDLGAAALAQQSHDELKQRVFAQARSMSADDYAFTRTVRTEQTSNGKTEKKITVEKFDPTRPAEARWTLVSVDGGSLSPDALNTYRKEVAKRSVIPGYHRLAGYFNTPATASTDSRGRTRLRFAALPKDTVKVMDTDVSQNATAEASLGESNGAPFAEAIRVTVRPMRLKLVMNLDRFELTSRYRIGPDGKPILIEQTSDMSGSGMGQEGKAHTEATYTDYRAVSSQR